MVEQIFDPPYICFQSGIFKMEISEICFEFCNDFLNFQNLVDEILIPPGV